MSSLDRLSNPSLSVPSLFHRKSNSRIHRHLKPLRATRYLSSAPQAPLLEHPSTSVICSLCQQGIPDGVAPYHFPKSAPAAIAALNPHIQQSGFPHDFCRACWVWIHNLSICWTCGETVSRHEGCVSFGWCWWHWACMSCLFCRTPLPPPFWSAKPSGITLETPPTCKGCAEDLTILGKLPSSSPLPPPPPPSSPPSKLQPSSSTFLETTPGKLITLRQPFQSRARPFPKWMAQLPSNRISKKVFSHPSICVPSRSTVSATTHPSSTLKESSSQALARSSPLPAQIWIGRFRGRAPPYILELSKAVAGDG